MDHRNAPQPGLATVKKLEKANDYQGLLGLLDPALPVAVRRAAARSLAHFAPRSAAPAIAARLNEDPDRGVRQFLAQGLGRLGEDVALPALLAASKDREPAVREEVAIALSRYNSPAAFEALLAALQEKEDPSAWMVRRSAAEALGRMADSRAVPALLEALRDESPLVRPAVATALGLLGDREAILPLKRIRHTTPHQRGAECAECRAIDAALRLLESSN